MKGNFNLAMLIYYWTLTSTSGRELLFSFFYCQKNICSDGEWLYFVTNGWMWNLPHHQVVCCWELPFSQKLRDTLLCNFVAMDENWEKSLFFVYAKLNVAPKARQQKNTINVCGTLRFVTLYVWEIQCKSEQIFTYIFSSMRK